ncbi:MAG: PEGA domain-containing protein [Proteobacteria bacterium]|nr:PEGA domain-containing protein [Pseudomonadota bacterium]
MRRRVTLALALVALLAAGAPARGARLAVFRIDPLGIDPRIVARLEGLLRAELGRLADATLPGTRALERLRLSHPALSDCTGEARCLALAGRLLAVDQIISGNIGALGDSYVINLKLVDVSSEREVRRVSDTLNGAPDRLIEAIRLAAFRLVAPERLRGSLNVQVGVPGAAVYLDGRLLGHSPLAPQHNLAVGRHTLRVSKAGHHDVLQAVEVPLQNVAQLIVALEPTISPQRPARRATAPQGVGAPPWFSRPWFWTTVGVGAAVLGAALGLALANDSGINCDAEPARCAR